MKLNLQLFAYSANPTQTAANKFNEFGGASTVLARKKAKAAGEPSNWRNYMKTPKPSEIRAPWTPTPATVTPTPRASSNIPSPIMSASDYANLPSSKEAERQALAYQRGGAVPPPMASGGSSGRPSSSGVPAPMSPSNGPGAGQGSSYQPNSPGLPSRGNVPPVRDQAMIDAYIKQQTGSKLTAAELAANQARTSAQTTANQSTATLENQLAQAVARLQASRQQASEGVQTGYDRAQALTKDNRVLQDGSFQRQANPFSGSTDYKSAMIGREREISDRQQSEDLNSRLGSINQDAMNQQGAVEQDINTSKTAIQQNLTALETKITENLQALRNATPAEEARLRMDLENNERQYAAALRGEQRSDVLAQAQLDQNEWQRGMEEFRTNYGIKSDTWDREFKVGESVKNDFRYDEEKSYRNKQDNIKNDAQYGGNYNPSGLSLNEVNQRMAENSASYEAANPEERKRLHNENLYLASLKGSTYDSATGEYSQGNNYVGTPTIDVQDRNFAQGMAVNEFNFKTGSYQQTFDENARQFNVATAIDKAFKDGQLSLDQYNSATQRMNAGTSQARTNWDMSPNNPDNLLKQLQVDQFGRPKQVTTDEVIDQLNNSTFVEYDQYTKRPVVYDPNGLAKSILSMNMSTQETNYLFSYYNIDPNKIMSSLGN